MRERYSRLFSLPDRLYTEGAPVLIAAGALLKDSYSNQVLAQLKFQNIATQPIKALTVSLQPFDTAGGILGQTITYQYLDLSVQRDDAFGSKTPIIFPDASARSYRASVTEVVFADNSVWHGSVANWHPLAAPVPLTQALADEELIRQYRIAYGADCMCKPTVCTDLWYCACGKVNRKEEAYCHHCHKNKTDLLSADLSALAIERDARIAREQKALADQKAVRAARTKKASKLALLIIPAVTVLILCTLLIVNALQKQRAEAAQAAAYQSATELFNTAQYEQAISAFLALGDYKDSATLADTATAFLRNAQNYTQAEALLAEEKYQEAHEIYVALGQYLDSSDKAIECEYQMVLHSLQAVPDADYPDRQAYAYTWFTNHKDYKDSSSYLSDFSERIISSHQSGYDISYVYDTRGLVCAYYTHYTDSNAQYCTTVEQTSFGNWYVVQFILNSKDVTTRLYYLQPYAPPFQSPSLFYVSDSFDPNNSVYKDGTLTLSFDDASIQYALSCSENGIITYKATRDDGDFRVDYRVTAKVNNGQITEVKTTGAGTANDGKPYQYNESYIYSYDSYGITSNCSWSRTDNWGGKKETKNEEYDRAPDYDNEGRLISHNAISYEYGFVYCPDTEQ